MKILITGGTGLIGRHLIARLLTLSHQITVLTRDPQRAQQKLGTHVTTLTTLDACANLDAFDAVFNLAGEPIADKRWTDEQKERLCRSRWDVTERLSKLIREGDNPPRVLISGSATGYYGNQDQILVTEDEPPVPEFTHTLCQRWEELALSAQSPRTRVCLSRTGVVLAADGGMLGKLLPLFKLGLGGPVGNGRQFLSWIHIDDMVDALIFLLNTDGLRGPFNLVAPYPVHNEQFAATLGEALRRPALMRAPAAAVKLMMGEGATLMLGGQRAVPKRLEEAGFSFHYMELKEALADIVKDE
ncbi:TIGR01777 family oxidoreductase [Acerihabitans arboris]|uniref:TIGR01777 family protein n=1 Tax=Acerihabitans arboris TaxID=2691583 RepID=A0A845SRP4_9GAMM|nr:TIGR01777 family oxidoreductase [Acerihabitans arboris]NDL65308.1 TIGR01777 family protein [Acerihabitans arboris]